MLKLARWLWTVQKNSLESSFQQLSVLSSKQMYFCKCHQRRVWLVRLASDQAANEKLSYSYTFFSRTVELDCMVPWVEIKVSLKSVCWLFSSSICTEPIVLRNGKYSGTTLLPLTVVHYNFWNVDTSLFSKMDRFFGPSITWTVHNLLDNAEAGMPLVQECLGPLIDFNIPGIIIVLERNHTSLWLSFLTSIQWGKTLECEEEYTCHTHWNILEAYSYFGGFRCISGGCGKCLHSRGTTVYDLQ